MYTVCMCLKICFMLCSSSEDDLLEFSYAMKVPLQVLREHNAIHRKYKYHVESPLTKSGAVLSLELITGINNARGVIDRCLRLHVDLGLLQNQSKLIYCNFYKCFI